MRRLRGTQTALRRKYGLNCVPPVTPRISRTYKRFISRFLEAIEGKGVVITRLPGAFKIAFHFSSLPKVYPENSPLQPARKLVSSPYSTLSPVLDACFATTRPSCDIRVIITWNQIRKMKYVPSGVPRTYIHYNLSIVSADSLSRLRIVTRDFCTISHDCPEIGLAREVLLLDNFSARLCARKGNSRSSFFYSV